MTYASETAPNSQIAMPDAISRTEDPVNTLTAAPRNGATPAKTPGAPILQLNCGEAEFT